MQCKEISHRQRVPIFKQKFVENYVKDTLGLIVHRQKYRPSGSNKNSSSQYFSEQQSFQFPLRNIPKKLTKIKR